MKIKCLLNGLCDYKTRKHFLKRMRQRYGNYLPLLMFLFAKPHSFENHPKNQFTAGYWYNKHMFLIRNDKLATYINKNL